MDPVTDDISPHLNHERTVRWGCEVKGLTLCFAFFKLVENASDRQQTLMSTICISSHSNFANVPPVSVCVCILYA